MYLSYLERTGKI